MSVPHPIGAPGRPLRRVASDYLSLTKPAITRMCLLMTAGGLWLAPEASGWVALVGVLLGTAMAVGSANALNMWWERGADRLMARTRDRPLADERISASGALAFGLILGAASLVLLATTTNLLTAALGAFALVSYVAIYTPLKYRTPLALVIGAVPGAMPPLMGWTAATGRIDQAALVLFAILLIWQLPHFLAISLYRKKDYARAGIRIVPIVRGDAVARRQAIAWTTALVPISLLLTPLGVTGTLYLVIAAATGLAFLAWSVTGLRAPDGPRWARGFFLASLAYLPLLTVGFVLDRLLG